MNLRRILAAVMAACVLAAFAAGCGEASNNLTDSEATGQSSTPSGIPRERTSGMNGR